MEGACNITAIRIIIMMMYSAASDRELHAVLCAFKGVV